MEEIWKQIPDYPKYEASNTGNIRNIVRKIPLTAHISTRGGYRLVNLSIATKGGHTRKCSRLVLLAFVGKCPDGFHAAHLDGNSKNDELSNLAWCSPKENAKHKILHGTYYEKENHPNAKLTRAAVGYIREHYRIGKAKELGKKFGVSHVTVQQVARGRGWAGV